MNRPEVEKKVLDTIARLPGVEFRIVCDNVYGKGPSLSAVDEKTLFDVLESLRENGQIWAAARGGPYSLRTPPAPTKPRTGNICARPEKKTLL